MQTSGNITNANRARKVRAAHKAADIKAKLVERVTEGPRVRLPALMGGHDAASHWDSARMAGMFETDLGRLIGFQVNDPGASDHGEFRALSEVEIAVPRNLASATRRQVNAVRRQLTGMIPVFEADALAALCRFGK